MELDWFSEFDRHLMQDEKPSVYFTGLLKDGGFPDHYPFSLISDLKKVPQSPQHHPEGDVFRHTMQVTDIAAMLKDKSEYPRALMWAALLHDLGKIPTTTLRRGKITSYDHDKAGEKMAGDFLRHCTRDEALIGQVCALVRWHMQILFVLRGLPFADVKGMLRQISVKEVALLGYCDRLGRGTITEDAMAEEKDNMEKFIKKCNSIH